MNVLFIPQKISIISPKFETLNIFNNKKIKRLLDILTRYNTKIRKKKKLCF